MKIDWKYLLSLPKWVREIEMKKMVKKQNENKSRKKNQTRQSIKNFVK